MVIKLAPVDDAGVEVHAEGPVSTGALVLSERPGPQTLLLAVPRGFCAGVIRAIDTVRSALQILSPPVYVRREIVHNEHVVQELAAEGAIFVDTLGSIPDGAAVVFSAHGVSPAVREEADRRHLRVIDATCPLVTKVHLEAIRYARQNYSIVLIGHPDHDEVVGTAGEAPEAIRVVTSIEDVDRLDLPDATRVAYLTQTTLSVDDTAEIVARLRARFPEVASPVAQDICYATQNRQNAVKAMAPRVDLLLVVGARNSSNSNRLVEVGARAGVAAHLISGVGSIREEWLTGCRSIGLTAGASTPDILIDEVAAWLHARGCDRVEKVEVISENIHFPLPELGDGAEP
jgi:4-hydroxy-3-methylbut-2-enyl diphosphate reductase